jgi:hypothetical protein
MDDVFYDDLRAEVQDELVATESEDPDNIEERVDDIEGADDPPLFMIVLSKHLNSVDMSQFFDGYGVIQQSRVVQEVARALDANPESPGETVQQVANVLLSISQSERDELDPSFRNSIEDFYNEIIGEVEEGDLQTARSILEKHNIKWHTQVYEWPGSLESEEEDD